MVVRVDDVADRPVGDRGEHPEDVVVVNLELVVHQDHALVGDQRGDVAGHKLVVDHVQIVRDGDQVQLGRLGRLLAPDVDGRHDQK